MVMFVAFASPTMVWMGMLSVAHSPLISCYTLLLNLKPVVRTRVVVWWCLKNGRMKQHVRKHWCRMHMVVALQWWSVLQSIDSPVINIAPIQPPHLSYRAATVVVMNQLPQWQHLISHRNVVVTRAPRYYSFIIGSWVCYLYIIFINSMSCSFIMMSSSSLC